MKSINIQLSETEKGKITLNGVTGYYHTKMNDGSKDVPKIVLIYSSGMSSAWLDETEELMEALEEKFK